MGTQARLWHLLLAVKHLAERGTWIQSPNPCRCQGTITVKALLWSFKLFLTTY